jgi:hypothetical protein
LRGRNLHPKQKEVAEIKLWVETRQNFSGKTENLDCELVVLADYFVILKHTVQTEIQESKFNMTTGSVTYRFHWTDRSYNLRKFFSADGALLANCLQLVDSVEVSETAVAWRDLNSAILVRPDGDAQVVKGDDRPPLSETWLHIFIEANQQELLRKYPEIIGETDRMLRKYQAGQLIWK